MAGNPETPDVFLGLLQGVWFPTHISVDGKLLATYEPEFPAPNKPYLWLMTITGDAFHATANADYYATGGRLRVQPELGRLTHELPPLPPEFDTQWAFRLDGNELLQQSGGFPWSGPHDSVVAFRFVRVATAPTVEMKSLIESVMRQWRWYPGRT